MKIKITDNAKSFIEKLLEENEPYQLRLYPVPGCCSPSFQLTLGRVKDTDTVENSNGINIAVDSKVESTEMLTIETKKGVQGTELVLSGIKTCGH